MTGNMAFVVDQHGATLELGSHDTVVLVHADGRRERIGLRALGTVVLHGDVKLSTRLLQRLAAHGVALTVLPLRGRQQAASFGQLPHRHAMLRHRQHLAFADPERRLTLARYAVLSKLDAMAEFARDHGFADPDAYYRAMRTASAATRTDALMGVEGAASARYFDELALLYERSGCFRFNGRSRQPPLDEPNAMMSLTYTLAQGEAMQLCLRAGLDVQIGFLHAPHRDRQALALDLIEPARAWLDRWVYELLAGKRLLDAGMFTRGAGQVLLCKEGRALFYPAWFRDGYRIAQRPMRKLLATMLGVLRQDPRTEPRSD